MRKFTFLGLVVALLLGVPVYGQTVLFVSPTGSDGNGGLSWESSKQTLAGALAAVSGTTHIYMKVGSYACNNVVIPDGVTVTGGYASSSTGTDTMQRLYPGTNANWTHESLCTILDANSTSRVATVNAGGKLEGCIVTKGRLNGNGGGVLIDGGTVSHCVIIRNSAIDEAYLTAKGGGAYVQNNGRLLNCVVAYNFANNGPAVAGTDGILTNNTITSNYTMSNCGTLTDIDGNIYNTVVIGEQCWMRENLRTTRYSDGTEITLGGGSFSSLPRRYYPNNSQDNVAVYGFLYSWPAVMRGAASSSDNPSGVRGVCPTGWHVPSDAEWTQMFNYLQSYTAYQCNDDVRSIAKSMAATTGWYSTETICHVGNAPELNNVSGFGVLPAGMAEVYQSTGTWHVRYKDFSYQAYFWSASADNSNYPTKIVMDYNSDTITKNHNILDDGFSVRCLRDDNSGTSASLPTIITEDVSYSSPSNATGGGNVTDDGGSMVTDRGVCWSTSQNPTIADNHTSDGTGVGSFTSSLTGLTAGTTYYVRAYAVNSVGTAYGNEISFTMVQVSQDGQPCQEAPSVMDYDGNIYNTVIIGNQCWMKENLRTTHYADGVSINLGDSRSNTIPYMYYPNNNAANVFTYGYLYNWSAVMHGAASSSNNPSGVRGVCPTGWHVPSRDEWDQLSDYVSSTPEYMCNGNTDFYAKALASTMGWANNDGAPCTIGCLPSENNATGFGALPAGAYDGSYYAFTSRAIFWCATEIGEYWAWGISLSHYNYFMDHGNDTKYVSYSVRCLRD